MRTPSLQYLYLQKPITMIVIVCILSVFPWIGMGEFSTKGEPREASVAISMLESGNWVLPTVYADEFAYKPPMAHWMMAVFSLPEGHVSEFTARLPSALAFIVLIGCTLFFFGERMKFQEAFISVLLLLTCLEIHRAGMTTRVDMLLTTFIVLALYLLYRWENKGELKGLPVGIPILLGCAVLTKGPVGVILPLFVFGVYLLVLNKHPLLTVFKSLLYIGVASLFLPLIWYVAAWRQGGHDFLEVVLAENFGRFFSLSTPDIDYRLGHENGLWYNFMTLIAGFVPWTLFFFFSLFGMKLRRPRQSFREILRGMWGRIRSMEKIKLFSLVALVCIFVFYSIPTSKRSVYLMPAYPFIAVFLAQYALYLTEYRTKVTRVFAGFLAAIAGIAFLGLALVMAGVVDPVGLASRFTADARTLNDIRAVEAILSAPYALSLAILLVVGIALATVFYQMSKKINLKVLYATVFLVFAVNLLIDGVVMRGIRKANSSRPFAEEIKAAYPIDDTNTYVMNNLLEYKNMYGLNFYLGNCFHDFKDKQPSEGYFLTADDDMEKVLTRYGAAYTFHPLATTGHPISEVRQPITLYHFLRK